MANRGFQMPFNPWTELTKKRPPQTPNTSFQYPLELPPGASSLPPPAPSPGNLRIYENSQLAAAPNSRPGMKPGGDPGVWDLQNSLKAKGANIATDGIMGPQTRAAMARFGVSASPGAGGGPSGPSPAPGPSAPGPATQATGGPSGDFLSQLMSALGPAPQAPSYDPKQVALDTISQQYGSQESAINRAMQNTDNLYQTQIGAQQKYGANADQRLQAVYDALNNDLVKGQGQTSQNYDQASKSVGSSYDQATQGLSELNNQIGGQFLQNADKLGITQGAASPLSKLQQTYAMMQGTNLQNKANSLAGLSQDQANFLGLGQSGIDSSRKQGAQARADVATQVRSALAQLGLSNAQTQTEYQGQLTDLEKNKASDYRNLLQQLGQSQYEQQRQSRLDQLAELVQLGTLDTQRQYMGIRQQTADQNYQLGLGNLGLQQQKLQLELAQTNDPLKRQQLQAQIDSLNANSQQSLAQADYYSRGGSQGQKGPYNDVLLQWLSQSQPGLWGSEGAGPKFQKALYDPAEGLIPKAQSNSYQTGMDPFTYATSQVPGIAQAQGLDLNGLLRALQLYFKGA
jgi:hypothetical protein